MNNFAWILHLERIKRDKRLSLRHKLHNELKAQGKTTHAAGLAGQRDMSFYDIDRVINRLTGDPAKLVRSLGKMTDLTDEDAQERKLFELNMDFLEAADWGDTVLGQVLVDAGVDVNFTHPARGKSALHIAAARSRGFTRFLVNTGQCDFLLEDKQGRLPYNLAYSFLKDRGVGLLLLKKAHQQAQSQGHENLQTYIAEHNTLDLNE